MARLHTLAATALILSLAGACRESGGTLIPRDSGPGGDGDASADGGTSGDGGSNPGRDGGNTPPRDGGEITTECNNPPLVPPASGTCTVRPNNGSNESILIRANLITPEGLLENAQLLISASPATRGQILCAECDCSRFAEANGATELTCANGVVSPGLINAHDHITFTEAPPAPHGDERFDHRHDWRRGQDGHTRIPSVSNMGEDHGIWWGELRNVLAGTTSINGSGGAAGLLRNLDQPAALQEGLNQPRVRYSTFPLRDSDGARRESGCDYGSTLDSPNDPAIADAVAYAPHIAEGIDSTARNEFLCLSSDALGSPDTDVILNKTAVIHGIGLIATDFAVMAADRASLIWSPRSNVDLYGNTAQVVLAANSGVRVAIGTDWAISGSMNMLRELRCASDLNSRNYGGYFSDRELVDMATIHAAGALGQAGRLGALAPGHAADIAIWNGANHQKYRAVLDAEPADVVLVLRAGIALYGDQPVMTALPDTQAECETLDVCGAQKLLCAQRETGSTIADMRNGNGSNSAIASNAYDLFFCASPPNEPSCVPFRPGMDGYMGVASPGDGDGDGIMDALDNCPSVFNPIRPLDDDTQPNADGDGDGDACDPCPLDANTTTCSAPNPNDRDGDGHEDAADNCPTDPNPGQENRDGDDRGDACDDCPDVANSAGAGCPATIYQVKRGEVTGRVVLEDSIVTAVGTSGWFMQIAPGDAAYDATLQERYSGVFVYAGTGATMPLVGDRVDVSGTAADFFGEKQVNASAQQQGSFTVRSSGNTVPAPVVVLPAELATDPTSGVHGPRAEELEGVLVSVVGVTVTSIDPPRGSEMADPINEFVVADVLRVNDYLYLASPFPLVGDALAYVTGIHHFHFENYKVEPRGSEDLGTRERLSAIEPMEAFVPAGTSGVPPGGLAVVMNRPMTSGVTVSLSSSSALTGVPATVSIPAGASRADIPLQVSPMERGTVTITASYDGASVFAELEVFDDAAPRAIASLSLSPTTLPVGGTAMGTLTLDLPGQNNGMGTVVSLEVAPPGLATVAPTSVLVPAGALSATFALMAGTSTGAGTLTASPLGGMPASVMFNVVIVTSRPPAPGELVITEILRNPNGANEKEREWFEVHNPTSVDLELDGLVLSDAARSYTIAAPIVLPANGHGVFAYYADPAQNGGLSNVLAEYGPAADIALNNGDETITLTLGGQVIDTVTYSGSWPGAAQDVAMCLRAPYPADNAAQPGWGDAVGVYGSTGAQGSPGLVNDATNCP